jgi:hypothetical protein
LLFPDPQEVNDAWVFLLSLLDAGILQASAQDEYDIKPVLADGDGRKDRSYLEENSCLRRRNDDLAASSNQVINLLVQLDNLLVFAVEKLVHCELAAGVRLVAVLELAAAAGTGPLGFRHRILRCSFRHGTSTPSQKTPRHALNIA